MHRRGPPPPLIPGFRAGGGGGGGGRLVPFVSEGSGRKAERRGRVHERRRGRVVPETELSLRLRDFDRAGLVPVDFEDRAAQRVLRAPSVRGWAESRIAPCAGPLGRRIDLRVRVRFLVADQ